MRTKIRALCCACMMILMMAMPAMAANGDRCTSSGCYGIYRNGFCSSNTNHYEEPTVENNIYQISNGGQLYWFAAHVNAGNRYAKAVLTQNITVNSNVLKSDGTLNSGSFRNWTPVGNAPNYYSGTFDGQGYTVSGLYLNAAGTDHVGLFSSVYDNGSVQNVSITDSYFRGYKEVAAIVGYNRGTVANCHNKGATVLCSYDDGGGIVGYNSGTIRACTNAGSISGNGHVAGIAGYSSGMISGCVNSGSITASPNSGRSVSAAGIVANNHGDVTKCHNSGSISAATKTGYEDVGGIVAGLFEGTVSHCSNVGTLTSGYHAGGVVATIPSTSSGSNEEAFIINCFSACTIDCSSGAGIVYQNSGSVIDCYYDRTLAPIQAIGQAYNGIVSETYGRTSAEFASGEVAWLLQGEQEEAIWGQNIDGEGTKDDVPVLDGPKVYYGDRGTCAVGYSNTPLDSNQYPHSFENGFCTVCDAYEAAEEVEGVYQIGNAGQLYWFAKLVNDGQPAVSAILNEDIVVNSNVLKANGTLNDSANQHRTWVPVGIGSYAKFAGTFDGNGKTVSGLYLSDPAQSNVGLIGYGSGTVKSVTVNDSYFCGKEYVGSVVGRANGMTISDCHNNSTVTGESYVGGVAGTGAVVNCSNTSSVTGTGSSVGGVTGSGNATECSNAGTVNGGSGNYTGGITGSGSAAKCSNTGTVTGRGHNTGGITGYSSGDITDCTNTGTVTGGGSYTGGIVGQTIKAATGCTNTGEVTGNGSYAGGICGYGSATDSRNTGAVTNNDSYTGGVTGQGSVTRCVNTGTVIGAGQCTGGLVGQAQNILNSYNTGNVTGGSYVGGLAGWMRYNYAIENSYHDGTVSADETGEYAGALVGKLAKTLNNSYYNSSRCSLPAVGDDTVLSGTEGKTTEMFASGMVAYLLQGEQEALVWGQNIDGEGERDSRPVLNGPKVFYGYLSCAEEAEQVYTNRETTSEKPEHQLESTVQNPTCTEDGYTLYSCKNCSYTQQVDIEAVGHAAVKDEAVVPTCTKSGLTEGSHCETCGTVLTAQEEIEATGHTEVIDEAVEATCGATGLTQGVHCSVCGTIITAQMEVPATGQHGYRVDKAVAATCTEPGLTTGASCPNCEHVYIAQEEVPATGHEAVIDAAVAPTCTATGLTEGSHCNVCNEVLVAQNIQPMIAHTPVIDPAVEPTCQKTGLTEGLHCAMCNGVLVQQEVVEKALHSVVIDEPKTPTCTEEGRAGEGLHCSVCGEVLGAQTVIPALGHRYDKESVNFTWSNDGTTAIYIATCVVCKETATGDAAMSSQIVSQPSEYENGTIEYIATITLNDEVYTETKPVVIPATGHTHMYGTATFEWAPDFSGVVAKVACDGLCTDNAKVLSTDCTVVCDASVKGKLIFTAAGLLNNQTVCDVKELAIVENNGIQTLEMPWKPSESMLIVIAGYKASGQMTGCQIVTEPSQSVEISVTGHQIKVFFVDKITNAPMYPVLTSK